MTDFVLERIKQGRGLCPLQYGMLGCEDNVCQRGIYIAQPERKRKKGKYKRMKVSYVCEKCGKKYDTEGEAIACEKRHEVKSGRQKEIDTLVRSFYEDYGHFPTMTFSWDNINSKNTLDESTKTSIQAFQDLLRNLFN